MPEKCWNPAVQELNAANLRALTQGLLPAIHVREFASSEECHRLCTAIKSCAADSIEASTSPMSLIGSNLSNSMHLSKAQYFKAAEQSWQQLEDITRVADFRPLDRVVETLSGLWSAPVAVASEPLFGRYFAGGIKTRVAGSALHFDFAPITTDKYSIGKIVDQLSWNLYLDMPAATGSTTIYNAPIDTNVRAAPNAADGSEMSGHWPNKLSPESVQDAEAYTFRPEVGELALLNTRYPHTVLMDDVKDGEWRAQTGSFIGRLADQQLVLWS